MVCFVAGIGATLAMAIVRPRARRRRSPWWCTTGATPMASCSRRSWRLAAAGLITRIRRATDGGRIAHDDVAGVVARWPGADYCLRAHRLPEEVAAHLWLGVLTDRVRVGGLEHAGCRRRPRGAPGPHRRPASVRPVRDAGGAFARAGGPGPGTWVALNAPA
ncbi:MAG: hypothetical protein R3F43_15765 [bacterium]